MSSRPSDWINTLTTQYTLLCGHSQWMHARTMHKNNNTTTNNNKWLIGARALIPRTQCLISLWLLSVCFCFPLPSPCSHHLWSINQFQFVRSFDRQCRRHFSLSFFRVHTHHLPPNAQKCCKHHTARHLLFDCSRVEIWVVVAAAAVAAVIS